MPPDQFETLLANKGENKQREQPSTTNGKDSIEKSLRTLFNTGQFSAESMMAAIKSVPNLNSDSNGHTSIVDKSQAADVNHSNKIVLQEVQSPGDTDKTKKETQPGATRKLLVEKTESKTTLLGLIKLYRKSLKNGRLRNHKLWTFLTYCFLKASHKKRTSKIGHQSVELQPGEFIFGRKKASEETKLSIQEIRTCLTKFKKAGNLTIKSTNKYSIVTICNWGDLSG